MRRLIHLIVFFLVSATCSFTSYALTDAEAINVSGSQRMLSQRMMKSYLMLGADIKADTAQSQLNDSVKLFEERLSALQAYAPSKNIRDRLTKVEKLWSAHRTKITAAPQKDAMDALMTENVELLKACHQVVLAIAEHSGVAGADLVNVSGRQRMLSQRIAKAYIALYWNGKSSAVQKEFEEAKQQFDAALVKLQSSPMNTIEVKEALNKVESQWKFSQSGFRLDDSGHYVPTVISVTTESILWKMNDITKMYELIMESQNS